MKQMRDEWKALIAAALLHYSKNEGSGQELGIDEILGSIQLEVPPKPEMGDLAVPLFNFAKALRKGPPAIAQGLAAALSHDSGGEKAYREQLPDYAKRLKAALPDLNPDGLVSAFRSGGLGRAEAAGPYLNVRFERGAAVASIFAELGKSGEAYGNSASLGGQRVLLEFSSPNTNKPLHLGHLRNNALGESASRILKACGAEVKKVNLFNDRGIHICKSMVAYERWAKGETPDSAGKKSDHFVADLYVRYQQELKNQVAELKAANPLLADQEDDDLWLKTEIGLAAQEMLRAWERGDAQVLELWKTMNSWAIDGIMETYRKTGVGFDWIQYEHDTYLLGKAEVLKGLEKQVFFRREDGAVCVELPWKDNAQAESKARKVVLRADGTSIYLTQDLGTAINRHEVWPFDQAVYVVANEQDYHFKVLFHCLKALGYAWAERLYHLSYGLVNLPTGRMKTREGTVVDADVLLEELATLSENEITSKGREKELESVKETSQKVALGALHYFLLQASPGKDMIFNPAESLSFNGNTGPYLQYMGARISSILRKWDGDSEDFSAVDAGLLREDPAWELLKTVASYPEAVEQAAAALDPSRVCTQLYELAKGFSRFYQELPILNAETPALIRARLALVRACEIVLRHGTGLLNIPFLEEM